MTITKLKRQALSTRGALAEFNRMQDVLMVMVMEYLKDNRGGVREIARKMGFSPQYICDVQHGRRKVSTEFLARLERL